MGKSRFQRAFVQNSGLCACVCVCTNVCSSSNGLSWLLPTQSIPVSGDLQLPECAHSTLSWPGPISWDGTQVGAGSSQSEGPLCTSPGAVTRWEGWGPSSCPSTSQGQEVSPGWQDNCHWSHKYLKCKLSGRFWNRAGGTPWCVKSSLLSNSPIQVPWEFQGGYTSLFNL